MWRVDILLRSIVRKVLSLLLSLSLIASSTPFLKKTLFISLKPASRDNNPSLRDFSARSTILSIVPVKSKFSDNITFLKTVPIFRTAFIG